VPVDRETVEWSAAYINNPKPVSLTRLEINDRERHLRATNEAARAINQSRVRDWHWGRAVEVANMYEASASDLFSDLRTQCSVSKGAGSWYQSASVMMVDSSSTSYKSVCGSSGS
jgi:hypothetical protein